VAEHIATGHFLRVIYNRELYHSTLLREGEAVGFGPQFRLSVYIYEERKRKYSIPGLIEPEYDSNVVFIRAFCISLANYLITVTLGRDDRYLNFAYSFKNG